MQRYRKTIRQKNINKMIFTLLPHCFERDITMEWEYIVTFTHPFSNTVSTIECDVNHEGWHRRVYVHLRFYERFFSRLKPHTIFISNDKSIWSFKVTITGYNTLLFEKFHDLYGNKSLTQIMNIRSSSLSWVCFQFM